MAVFTIRLALSCQEIFCSGKYPYHRIDDRMRVRIWHWFSEAQKAGIVVG